MRGRPSLLALVTLCAAIPCSSWAATTMKVARYRLASDSTWISLAPITRAAVQGVLDRATSSRHLELRLGPGNIDADSSIWIHGNTSIRGAGRGRTTISRSHFDPRGPAGSGDILVSAPYGRHAVNGGLVRGLPADSLESIEISGLTVDGHCGRWASVNPNGSRNFGINLFYVESPKLENIEVRNTLQTGIQYYGCRNGVMAHIWTRDTGKEVMVGTRNGINLNDNADARLPKRWGEGFTLSDIHIRNQKDTAFGFCNVSNVNGRDVWIECSQDTSFGNFAFEFEGHTPGYMMHGFRIRNVHASGLANQFLSNGIREGAGLEDAVFDSCYSVFSAKAHRGGALNLKSSNSNQLIDFTIANSRFSNINTSNGDGKAASAAMVYCFNDGSKMSSGLRVAHCNFRGGSPESHHPANPGIKFGGNFHDVLFDSVTVVGAEAEGFFVAVGKNSLSDVTIRNCVVDGAQSAGFSVGARVDPGVIDGVTFQGCVAKDTNRSGDGNSFQIVGATGGRVRNIRVEGCRAIRSTGSFMKGLRVVQDSGGVVDSVSVLDSDFSQAAGEPYSASGTITDLVLPGSPK